MSDQVLTFTNYITLLAIIAWRISWLSFVNRVNSDEACTTILSELEWKALYSTIHKTKEIPNKVPTVKDVVKWIAQLGGFLNRKSDGNPGGTVIWRGWQRLMDLVLMREIMS